MIIRNRGISLFALILLVASLAGAQDLSFRDIVGTDQRDRITTHHLMLKYLEEVAGQSSRIEIVSQGVSWEERELMLAVVTSPANHARLDQIRETARRLGDARITSTEEAAALIENQPAIVWLGGSIHGFELSGAEGLFKLIERLTTSEDPETLEVLENVVILIDPMLNPDGRDAFANRNHENLGRRANPLRVDWTNDYTTWESLKFRTGHYYFDTNRDWWAQTQRETLIRAKTIVKWRPQVVVDLHEMGSDSEFYFDPPTEPYGPLFPSFAKEWFVKFGKEYAKAFDDAGFEYMTRERYNYFYPGYTTSWGSYQGAVGMLYEQGSPRGLAITRSDDSVRTLADARDQQYTAAWTAVRTAAVDRVALLKGYHEGQRQAILDGNRGIRRYLLTNDGDPSLIYKATDTLAKNGIEVSVLTKDVRLDGVRDRNGSSVGSRTFNTGTYVIEAAQPRNRLVRSLLEPGVDLPAEFLGEARARVDRGENPKFYDITTWSLPLLFNLEGFSSTDGRTVSVRPLEDEEAKDQDELGRGKKRRGPPESTRKSVPAAKYAWLIDGRSVSSMIALVKLKSEGYRVALTTRPTRIEGKDVAAGTVVVRAGQNDESVREVIEEAASDFDLDVRTVDTGFAEAGYPALGSGDHVITVTEPKVAILAEGAIHPYSFGWCWYKLDRQYEVPLTVLRGASVAVTPLEQFNVLIVPNVLSVDGLARDLGEDGTERLRRWVRDGGTLVVIGDAVEFARKNLEMLHLRSWYEEQVSGKRDDGGEPDEPQRFVVPGAIARVRLDDQNWISSGYDGAEFPALVTSSRIYLGPKGPPSNAKRIVATYATSGSLFVSGHAWPESIERLAGSVFAYEEIVGKGRVIAFSEDLNFRGYWRGADRLFLNAVLIGPSAP